MVGWNPNKHISAREITSAYVKIKEIMKIISWITRGWIRNRTWFAGVVWHQQTVLLCHDRPGWSVMKKLSDWPIPDTWLPHLTWPDLQLTSSPPPSLICAASWSGVSLRNNIQLSLTPERPLSTFIYNVLSYLFPFLRITVNNIYVNLRLKDLKVYHCFSSPMFYECKYWCKYLSTDNDVGVEHTNKTLSLDIKSSMAKMN